MTEVDKVFQIAARRVQGLTAKVNHWKQRANELEAALGIEKAARDKALNAGSANVKLQEELKKERAEHQETSRYLAEANSKMRELLRPDGDFQSLRRQRDRALDMFGTAELNSQTLEWSLADSNQANDSLRAEVADLRGTVDAVHVALGIKSGDNIIEAIYRLKSSDWFDERNRLEYQVIPDLEKQRDGLTTQIQDMRNEIARLRADLRTMSERSNGSEWEKKAAEIEELRAELNCVKQERDCAKSEWDRAEGRCKALGGEVAELFSDRQRLKAELAVIKDERNELRGKLEASEAESRGYYEELSQIRREPNTPTPRSHPVKVGEWVKRTYEEASEEDSRFKIGAVALVIKATSSAYVVDFCGVETTWMFVNCTPCDPPETTEQMMLRREREFAVKEAAANALEDFDRDVRKIQREPKPGNKVRMFQLPPPSPSGTEWDEEWGKIGDIGTISNLVNGGVRIRETGYEWPLSCIEIVDVK